MRLYCLPSVGVSLCPFALILDMPAAPSLRRYTLSGKKRSGRGDSTLDEAEDDTEVEFILSHREVAAVVGSAALRAALQGATANPTTPAVAPIRGEDIDCDLSGFLSPSGGSSGQLKGQGKGRAGPRGAAQPERILGVLSTGSVLLITGSGLLHFAASVARELRALSGAVATPTSLLQAIQARLPTSHLSSFYATVWDALHFVHTSVLGSVDDFFGDPYSGSSGKILVAALRKTGPTRFSVFGMCVCSELPMAVRCFVPAPQPVPEDAALSSLQDLESDEAWAGKPVELGDTRCTGCICGVHLIWTSRGAQGRGYASAMVDACRTALVYSHVIPRSQVAFSQPTRQGKLLALRYTGRRDFLTFL